MKRFVWCAFVAIAIAPSLFAQKAEPAEPEIVLPPVLLKVQDVTQEKIDTPLPTEQSPALPQIDVALPEAQSIILGSAAYEVPLPGQGPAGGPVGASKAPAESFFSDGVIGAGSMNHIIGDITLYKLGSEPRFNLEFSHERIEGYLDPTGSSVFRPAGAGFFNRTDALIGGLTYSSKNRFNFDTHDFYREVENGLQGLGAYSSVTHRFISGKATAEYNGTSRLSFGAGVDAKSGDMTLASPTPASALNARELSVTPSLNMGLNLGKVSGRLNGFYGLTQTTDQSGYQRQAAGGSLSLNAELPLALTLNGTVGAQWDSSVGWVIPFSLELDGVYKDLFTYRLYGGYKVDRTSYFDVWSKYPFLDQATRLKSSLEWYGGGRAEWHFGPSFGLQTGLDFSSASAAILPGGPSPSGTGLFTFTQGRATTLDPSVTFSWEPKGPFSLKVGWNGHFLDPAPFVPVSSFNLDAELNNPAGRYGGALTGTMDLTDTSTWSLQMPNLSLSGYFRVSNGVSFHLNIDDLLSPLSSGRKTWNYYYDPGFHVTVTTQISL